MKSRAALLFAIACFARPPDCAADTWLGLGGGLTRTDAATLTTGYPLDGSGPLPRENVRAATGSEDRGAWRVFAGWRPFAHVAFEASHADYGASRFGFEGLRQSPFGPPALRLTEQSRQARRRVAATGVDVLVPWPVTPSIDLWAGIGIARARVRLEAKGTDRQLATAEIATTGTSSHTVRRSVLGASWSATPAWRARLHFEHLAAAGSAFAPGSELHTGRSSQRTIWLSAVRHF